MMKKRFSILLVSLFMGLFTSLTSSYASTITVDGSASDWAGILALGTDLDDMDNNDVDVKALYATNDNDNLYIRADVYGNINRTGHWYIIYLDTDQNSSTGFTYGWWTTGADYRIYIDQWSIGLQKFMGSSSTDDTWGWNGVLYALKTIPIAYSQGILECSIPRADIGESSFPESNNILFRAWPGDDSIPYYGDTPLSYTYYKGAANLPIDRFEYATDQELNSVYSIECDPATTMTAVSEATLHFQGDYSAKLTYSLGSLWSSVKLVRYFPISENWGDDKNLSLWVRGYSGCTENLLIYIIESDRDEWAYQSNAVLINDAWTKVIIPLSDLWDNPWDGNLGDGVKTLTDVVGYKIIIQDIADDGKSPINSSIYVDEFIRDNGLPSAAHPIPAVDNYACYYGGSRINDLSKFDLIIMNSDSYTTDEIAQMRAAGTIIIGYVSLGEDVRLLQVGDGKGPISSGALTYNGYASYYLDDNPKDGCPDRNQIWGGYFINAGNKEWQDYVIGALADQILNVKGCDGIFMDTIGIVEDPCYAWTRPGMISIIAAIRKAYPDKYLIANGGFTTIFGDLEEYVNALMFESFTSTYDFYSGTYNKWDQYGLDYTAVMANQINAVRAYPDNTTINVFSLDYCENDDAIICADDYNRAESFGFIPSIGNIYLSKIYMVNPANNFKASSLILGKARAVKLAWEAPQAYVSDSDVMYFVIKRSVLGPIITDAQWESAETLSAKISSSARSFTDTRPPAGTAYYALGALKKSGAQLIGRLTTLYSIKKVIKLN